MSSPTGEPLSPPPGSTDEAEWEELGRLIGAGDAAEVSVRLARWSPVDRSLIVSRLSEEERGRLLALVDSETAAALVSSMAEVQALDTLEQLSPRAAARILEQLPSSEQADVLGDLDAADAEAILGEMRPVEAEDARALAAYEDDVAGGLMRTELMRTRSGATVDYVLSDLLAGAERYRDFDIPFIYVVDAEDRLLGSLFQHDLLFTSRDRIVDEVMDPQPPRVHDQAPLPELVSFFDELRENVAAVIDGQNRLVGVLRRSAIEEAQTEATEHVYRQSAGIVGGEELRTMPVGVRSRRRLSWLSVNVLLNLVAASVIAANRETLEAAIALAVFLPVISDMSGCSGNQSVAVSMRELALGLVRPAEVRRVILQELSVGILTGAALGVLVALAAWAYEGNPWLAAVVGLALTLNTLIAVLLGGSLPLLLQRVGVDPALASSPILTTVTDMCGFLLVLRLASLVLPWLQAG